MHIAIRKNYKNIYDKLIVCRANANKKNAQNEVPRTSLGKEYISSKRLPSKENNELHNVRTLKAPMDNRKSTNKMVDDIKKKKMIGRKLTFKFKK